METLIIFKDPIRINLLGNKFMLMTDNNIITNFFIQPNLNARQAQWISSLSEFKFDIRHLKGNKN